ncbi:MAG: tRNA (guanosine(37)-N1)-methyltransferase TrmD [Tindallia sp. MSAO_Bac2]|nr:MAG: tRNA (guanosine(37)-N1)-methyltransferase TrmD [Tindallia sp. MSAO_Bac2]
MIIKVLTLFPEMLDSIFSHSILGRAQSKGAAAIEAVNIRDFSANKHNSVDDYPFGGGCGMVMTPQPIMDAHKHVMKNIQVKEKIRTIYCTPKGKVFNQDLAKELSREKALVFLCGHYEGVDQRVIDEVVTDEISIGDYVLTGGELPAAVMIDSVVRLLPGVLNQEQSYEDESFYNGLLEYPHYTRPREHQGKQVPNVLLSGDHAKIDAWRRYQSLKETWLKRPDLLEKKRLTEDEKKYLKQIQETSIKAEK